MRKITRDGVDICYYLRGEGPPLLLISGLGSGAASWWPIVDRLGAYKVISADNRECGGSTCCDGTEYTLADMARDLAAVLDDAGIETAYVIGVSMGGMIAQEFALKFPKRVRKLMLVCTNPGRGGSVPGDRGALGETFAQRAPGEDAVEFTMKRTIRLTGPGWADRHPDLLRKHAEIRVATGASGSGMARQTQAISKFSSWDRLSELRMPTLVVHGEADPLIPFENGARLASHIEEAELLPLPGVGHYVAMEAPDELVSAIDRFFPGGVGES